MHRRTLISALGTAPFACLCADRAWAQGRPLARGQRFCTFAAPSRPGGIGIRSYAVEANATRGKSQLTWSFSGRLNGVPDPVGVLKTSFETWRGLQGEAALGFRPVAPVPGNADIVITVADLGGFDPSGSLVLGVTEARDRSIRFNTNPAAVWAGTLFQEAATHEIGHALGLLHADTANSIMFPNVNGQVTLGPDDTAAIRALYGWTPQSKLAGGTEQPPALCDCGGTLAMAWRGTRDDQNIWFATSTDGINWTAQRRIQNAASAAGPGLAWDGRLLWMAWRGTSDNDNIYWANTSNFFNGAWTGVQKLGDRGSSHSPRVAIAAGAPVMVWKGVQDGQGIFWSRFAGGAWSPQAVVPDVGTAAAPAVCQDIDPHAARMLWRGTRQSDALFTSTLHGNDWAPQQVVTWKIPASHEHPASTGTPGSLDGPAVAFVDGKVLALWRGVKGDSGLYFTQLANDLVDDRNLVQWSAQTLIPNVGSAHGPALAAFKGTLHAVWRGIGDDNGLWTATL